MSPAWEDICSPTCVERWSTRSRARSCALPAACWACSFAWPAASWAFCWAWSVLLSSGMPLVGPAAVVVSAIHPPHGGFALVCGTGGAREAPAGRGGVDLAAADAVAGVVVVAARDQRRDDRERGEADVQDVVGGVDRDDPEHVVAVDQPDDGHEPVDEPEGQGDDARRPGAAEGRDQQQAGRDVHDV